MGKLVGHAEQPRFGLELQGSKGGVSLRQKLPLMLEQQAVEVLEQPLQRLEAEKLADRLLLVDPLRLGQLPLVGLPLLRFLPKSAYAAVHADAGRIEPAAQHNTFECLTAAERHIHLPVRKRLPGVDDDPLKSEPLALVDGDRPGEPERQLTKSTDDGLLHLLAGLVELVALVGPLGHLHDDIVGIALAAHAHEAGRQPGDGADAAVVVAAVAAAVIFDKHHLRPLFELQRRLRRIRMSGEVALDLGGKMQGRTRQGVQRLLVELSGRSIVGAKRDIVVVAGRKSRIVAAVEGLQQRLVDLPLAQPVEQTDKRLIRLPEDVRELNRQVVSLL